MYNTSSFFLLFQENTQVKAYTGKMSTNLTKPKWLDTHVLESILMRASYLLNLQSIKVNSIV